MEPMLPGADALRDEHEILRRLLAANSDGRFKTAFRSDGKPGTTLVVRELGGSLYVYVDDITLHELTRKGHTSLVGRDGYVTAEGKAALREAVESEARKVAMNAPDPVKV